MLNSTDLVPHPIGLYTHIYADVNRNIIKHNDDFKEQTNTLLYKKYIPLTLYSRKGCEGVDVGYVWEVRSWRRGQTATYWPKVFLTIAALLSHSGWAAQPWVAEGPSPLSGAGSHSVGILSPTATRTRTAQAVCGTWFYNCLTFNCFLWAYASAPNSTTSTCQCHIPISSNGCTCFAFFRLFTQMHLLIDGSVDGRYVAIVANIMREW